MKTKHEYMQKFGDTKRRLEWVDRELDSAKNPPVYFMADGNHSRNIAWKKHVCEAETFTDYANTEWPAKRTVKTVIYIAEELGLEIRTEITSYPEYPVVEYCSVLKNISDKNSPRLQNLLTVDGPITEGVEMGELYSAVGGKNSPECYRPCTDILKNGNRKHFEETGGRPTEQYLQNFNWFFPAQNRGIIAVVGWAGNWKVDFTLQEGNAFLQAGPQYTDFVLQPGETYKTPISVLIFYKGEKIDGQNIWRRWMYEHNIMRVQGIRRGIRLLMHTQRDWRFRATAADDIEAIQWAKENGLAELVDEFHQDAGWYPNRDAWCQVGEWRPDPIRFPDTLSVVADAAHAANMQYRLWFDPERVQKETIARGTNTIPKELLIGVVKDADGKPVYEEIGEYTASTEPLTEDDLVAHWDDDNKLVNYSNPEAVDRTIAYVNQWLDVNKVDVYRQDLNISPGQYWMVYDEHISQTMGIPRYGITEEKHTAGYRRLWDAIVSQHPGMVIDGCAGGGCRNDLETMRYCEPLTRTDYSGSIENAQNLSYGAAQWLVLMGGRCRPKNIPQNGTEFDTYDPYYWRTGTFTIRTIHVKPGIPGHYYTSESLKNAKKNLQNWKAFAAYTLYDFYPLTPFTDANDAVVSLQYDSPEKGIGMVVIYLRPEVTGTHTVYPTHLDAEAMYILHDEDGVQCDRTVSGAVLMQEGITVTAGDKPTAPYYTYRKV